MTLSHLTSLGFIQNLNPYKKISKARLLGLANKLSDWNLLRIAYNKVNVQSQQLSITDVHTLKEIIQTEINKSSIKCPEVIADQILFLVIGAIQVQTQTGSDKAWQLVHQSIQSFLEAQREKRTYLFGLLSLVFLISFSIAVLSNKTNTNYNSLPDSPILSVASAENATDQVTMSLLLLVYNKMKSGTCQLPQAAMLAPEQREAFLMFVNHGTVDVQHVENLRLALAYVNCLYPQELMHPMHSMQSSGNKL